MARRQLVDIDVQMLFDARAHRGQKVRAKRIDDKKLRIPRGARYWFTVRTIGGDFDVILANEKVVPDLVNRAGITDIDSGVIALADASPYLRLVVTLVHELMHAVWSTPGECELTARILGCKSDEADAREEEIVTHLAPKLADMLLRTGLLRLPPIPRKARANLPKKSRHRKG